MGGPSMAGTRRVVRWAALLAALGLFAASLAAPAARGFDQVADKAVASSISETVVIPAENYTVYSFSLWVGETIAYDIRVTQGFAIDVYFVPPDGLADYRDPLAALFRLYQGVENQRVIAGTFSAASGDVSVILDNVNRTDTGASPSGPVTVDVSLQKNPSFLYLGAVALIVFGIAVLAAVAILARRRAKAPPKPARRPPPKPYERRPPEEATSQAPAAEDETPPGP